MTVLGEISLGAGQVHSACHQLMVTGSHNTSPTFTHLSGASVVQETRVAREIMDQVEYVTEDIRDLETV